MKNLFIGVDFSKEKVDVAIIFADGLAETASRVFNEFKTTVSGYKQLIKWGSRTPAALSLPCGSSAEKTLAITVRDCATFSMAKATTCGLRMPRASRMHQVLDD